MYRERLLLWLAGVALVVAAACGGSGATTPTPLPSDTSGGTALPSPAGGTFWPEIGATPTSSDTAATPLPVAGHAQVIRKGNTSRKMVAFSFDAGSDTGYAAQILDTLKANGITASFALTGQWAERNPDLVKRIVNEGHSLMNHTYDHQSFTGGSTGKPPLNQAQRWEELDKTEKIIKDLTGASTQPYFRPPYGDYDESVDIDVYERGYLYNVMWSVDSQGWRGIVASAIIQRCLSAVAPGAIYIFHLGSASQDASALQSVIDGLRGQGYSIGSVPQVLAP